MVVKAAMFAVILFSTCTFKRDYINELPNELLEQVFQNAENLPCLPYVNRRFRYNAERQLYKSIRLIEEPRPAQSHQLLLLIRTLHERPDLLKKIKHLELNLYGMPFEAGHHRGPLSTPPGETEVQVATACARAVMGDQSFTYKAAWAQELRAGTLDAFVIYLLVQLPKLISVSLGGYTWNKIQFLAVISHGALPGPFGASARFQRLTHLNLRNRVDVHERRATKLTLSQLQQILKIRTLKSLAADMIESETGLWAWPPVPGAFDEPYRLTSLDITLLHEQNLNRVLSLLPALEKLTWTFWLNYKRPLGSVNMTCGRLQDALDRRRDTLKEIRIIPEHGFGRQWRVNKVGLENSLDFSAFPNLRILEIPMPMLLGPSWGVTIGNVLPLRINHLVLLDHAKFRHDGVAWNPVSLVRAFQVYLDNAVNSGGPHLSAITSKLVDRQGLNPSTWLAISNGLKRTCDSIGIDFFNGVKGRKAA